MTREQWQAMGFRADAAQVYADGDEVAASYLRAGASWDLAQAAGAHHVEVGLRRLQAQRRAAREARRLAMVGQAVTA